MRRHLKWIIPLAVVILLAAAVLIYVEDYYHASSVAKQALVSDDVVRVEKTDYGWFFDGPSEENALVFYPGGKVEETAYAPLLHLLAEKGMDACLVRMPARLAILDMNGAESVIKQYDYTHWYVGGHSLGGVACASFASENAELLDGVILLASYPTKQLDDSLSVVFIYGSEDRVLNLEKYEESKPFAPSGYAEYIISGGNHAQFGAYGFQKGDGTASISPEEQIQLTSDYIMETVSDS